ncbi:hypothetical protein F4802DRAFT_204492 [Xylaria palmicola]|nr:hypothetical protein F4802DRAFT_204492 [Xylaria palmicola]
MMQQASQQSAPRGPAPLMTPNQSFGEAGQPLEMHAAAWVDKHAKEQEVAMSRLSDQKFNMREYADPLTPRQYSQSQYYPKGVTAETERRLLDLVSRLKTGTA